MVGVDVAEALAEFIGTYSITNIVVGASSQGVLARYFQFNDLQVSKLCCMKKFKWMLDWSYVVSDRSFMSVDVPTSLGKSVPDFCSVYSVSSRGRVHNIRSASRALWGSNCSRQSSLSSLSLSDTPRSGDSSK